MEAQRQSRHCRGKMRVSLHVAQRELQTEEVSLWRVRRAHVLHTLFLIWLQSWISPQTCSYVSGILRTLKKTIMSICGPRFKASLRRRRRWKYSYLQFSWYSMLSTLPASFKKDWRQQKLNCEASSSTRRKEKKIFSACFVRTRRTSTLLQTVWQQWGSLLTPSHLWVQTFTQISSWCTVTQCQFWRWLDMSELGQHAGSFKCT